MLRHLLTQTSPDPDTRDHYGLEPQSRGNYLRRLVTMAALPWSAAQAATTGRTRNPEDIEAEVRKVMAAHAAIKARGFDSIKERGRLHRLTDVLLDELAIAEQVTPREL